MSAESSGGVSFKKIKPIKNIQDVIERSITKPPAAEHLGISDKQSRRHIAPYP
ncbi:ISNCY family transposase, partial [Klebsiella pneumoniae]